MKCALTVRAISVVIALATASPVPSTAQVPASGRVSRICLAPASVESAPGGGDPVAAVRDAFTSFLTGPTLAVQPLSARLQSQARQEAKLAGCGLLLLTTIRHVRRTGGSGFLGKLAGGAAQQGAWAATGAAGGSGVGRAVAGAATGAATGTVNEYATSSRQKDELTLSYRLEDADGAVLVERSEKRKAKSDGEDLLAPLVQHAAEAIAVAVAK